MKTREYADWLDGLVIDSKPCPKALKRVATRLRELEATIKGVRELPTTEVEVLETITEKPLFRGTFVRKKVVMHDSLLEALEQQK